MPTFIRDYRPGRPTSEGEPIERPSFDVYAVWPDECDAVFGTKGRAERVDWVKYLHERGLLLAPYADSGRLQAWVRLADGRHKRAYLLLCPESNIPRKRERRPERRVFHW